MTKPTKKRDKKYKPQYQEKPIETTMMKLTSSALRFLRDVPFDALVSIVTRKATPGCINTLRFRLEYARLGAPLVAQTAQVESMINKGIAIVEDVYRDKDNNPLCMAQIEAVLDALNIAEQFDDLLLRREVMSLYTEAQARMRKDPVFKQLNTDAYRDGLLPH